MKEVKRSVLKEPSTIVHSMMPSSVIAGRMEYLSHNELSKMRREDGDAPFASRKILLATRSKAFESPRAITQVRSSVAGALVDEDELFGGVVFPHREAVLRSFQFVPLLSMFRYLWPHRQSRTNK